MPYCNYNKGYLAGISRLRGHSVIRVIEMVSESEEGRGETVFLLDWSGGSEGEGGNTSGYKKGRVRVFRRRR